VIRRYVISIQQYVNVSPSHSESTLSPAGKRAPTKLRSASALGRAATLGPVDQNG
jgi:hypothetical protein